MSSKKQTRADKKRRCDGEEKSAVETRESQARVEGKSKRNRSHAGAGGPMRGRRDGTLAVPNCDFERNIASLQSTLAIKNCRCPVAERSRFLYITYRGGGDSRSNSGHPCPNVRIASIAARRRPKRTPTTRSSARPSAGG